MIPKTAAAIGFLLVPPVTDNSIAEYYYYYFINKLIRSLAHNVRILIGSKWDQRRGIRRDRVCSEDLPAACVCTAADRQLLSLLRYVVVD